MTSFANLIDASLPRSRALAVSWTAALPALGLLLGAAAVVAPGVALAAVLGGIFIAVALRDLAAGVAAFVLLMFFERLPGLPASQFSAIKVAGLILVLAWLGHAAANRDSMPFLTRTNPVIAYAVAALVVLAAVSMLWATDVEIARSSALRLAQGPVLLIIVVSALRTPQHLRWVLWAYLIGAVMTAAIGVGQTPTDDADIGRLSGGIRDPNQLAAALLPAIPIALFFVAVTRRILVRWALVSSLILLAAAVFMTGSRGGLIGLGVMFLAAIVLAGPLRPQVVLGISAVTGLAIAYYTLFAPPEVLWRLTHFSTGGGSGRIDLWSVALEMFRDHPLLGVGAGNFQVLEPSYALLSINLSDVGLILDATKVTHNTYLHVLVELGIIGLVCFTLIVLGAFLGGLRALRSLRTSGDRQTEILVRGVLIGMTGMLAAYTFISGQNEKQLWLGLGIMLSLSAVARAVRARNPEPLRLGVSPSIAPPR